MGDKSDSESTVYAIMILMAAVVVVLVIVCAPGMVTMALLRSRVLRKLDVPQMWTFSVLSSMAIAAASVFVVANYTHDTWPDFPHRAAIGGFLYAILSLLTTFLGLVMYFGFHVSFFKNAVLWHISSDADEYID